jgi:hypothetical protein
MQHNDSTTFSLPVLFAALFIGIIISVISFYSYKSCSGSTCTKHRTAAVISDAGKYITVAGPNGDEIKVSSKLSGLTAYIANDKNDNITAGDVASTSQNFWKTKFKNWREKMSKNNIAPSFTNFLDIVELSKVVQQN